MVSVAAPVRMITPGHSTSVGVSAPPATEAFACVAFDELLNRSSAEPLSMLLLPPQPASAMNAPAAANHPAAPAALIRTRPIPQSRCVIDPIVPAYSNPDVASPRRREKSEGRGVKPHSGSVRR